MKDIIILLLTTILIITYVFLAKYIPLELALTKIKQNNYSENYKCLDFSHDLQQELNKYGIQSDIVIGEDQNTAKQEMVKHAWIGIWVESQT